MSKTGDTMKPSLVDDDQSQQPAVGPSKRRPGRPKKEEAKARKAAAKAAAAAPAEEKKPRKPPERLNEDERNQRLLAFALRFPHPTVFGTKDALEEMPELGYLQNAYGFMKTAAKRNFVEALGEGSFRFTPTATAELQAALGYATNPAAVVKAPAPKLPRAPAIEQGSDAPSATKAPSAPAAAPISLSKPPLSPARRTVEGQTSAPAPRPAPEPAMQTAKDHLGTLLQLSRRYRADRYYNLDDFVVPLRECRVAVYGHAEIASGDTPVCVVIDAYEPDSKAVNPNDLDVMFLDAKGQAHVRSAASWMFLPYRKE